MALAVRNLKRSIVSNFDVRFSLPASENTKVAQNDVLLPRELEASMEDQPLPVDASPTTLSPSYIADSNPEEDEEDPKENPADYLADGGDNNDNESSDDDDDDDNVEKDEEDKEEEEHLALVDPFVVPTDDPVPSN
ncbi:hypothetical protein Tco_0195039 [Tanacetum coccineum]